LQFSQIRFTLERTFMTVLLSELFSLREEIFFLAAAADPDKGTLAIVTVFRYTVVTWQRPTRPS